MTPLFSNLSPAAEKATRVPNLTLFKRTQALDVTINSISEVEHEAEINIPNAELQPHFEQAYLDYRPKAEVKGFRKGKVPLGMIKRMFGEAIEHDALDTVANDMYRQAMAERNIQPIGRPSMVDMDFKRGQHLRFKIKYEVKPTIVLHDYKGLAIEKPIHHVTDEEVQAELARMQRANSTYTEVAAVTDEQHVVTGDVQELDNSGAPLIGKKSANVKFYLADETLAVEIKDALRTAQVSGVHHVELTSGSEDTKHTTRFAIKVTRVEQVHLPAFDDAFVVKITGGKVSTTEEFLKKLHADIERYWEDQANRSVSDAIAAELIRMHNFPVPESLIDGFLDALVDEVKAKSRDRQLPRDFDEKTFREENRAYATWQAKWLLLRERIAETEGITVTDEEIQRLAETDAVETGIGKDRLLRYYKNSGTVGDRILSNKLMAFLKEHAVITEKAIQEPLVKTS